MSRRDLMAWALFGLMAGVMLFAPWVMVPHAPTFEQRWPQ